MRINMQSPFVSGSIAAVIYAVIYVITGGVDAGLVIGSLIRRAILRLASPNAMRGRIAAVKSVFVGSSNELGAFESGMLAGLIGATAAVWTGGLATLYRRSNNGPT